MRYEITAPASGDTGLVAGVAFTAGHALVADPPPGAVEYFRRHGYRITPADDGPQDSKPAARARSRNKPGPSEGG
ncbi:hypothetical protein [Streptomyces catenulae]|uniref:Uncharacterized protein n=1 Tax=Streptomyces catenulae TaxID=66875 RepID=A0ABV2YXM1_9ACTN|nr:hypothetical protein [Streptomyces catenulae]